MTGFVSGNMELLDLLLNNHVWLHPDSVNGTPLQIAAYLGNAEAVKSLLSCGTDVGKLNLLLHCLLMIVLFKSLLVLPWRYLYS